MAKALKQAQEKHIPVVMFDSDVLPEDKDVRLTFIGTDNYSFGAELAKAVLKTKKGGTVCIQSGAPASLNLNDRVQGIRDTLAGVDKDHGVKRLTGQNGWTEPDGCPVYNNDDIKLAAQQVNDVFTAQPKLDAFIAVGGWAQYAPAAYKQAVELQKDRVASKDLVISFGDNFPPQMPLLKAGLSHFNIGQRPYDMAYTAVKSLVDVWDGKKPAPVDCDRRRDLHSRDCRHLRQVALTIQPGAGATGAWFPSVDRSTDRIFAPRPLLPRSKLESRGSPGSLSDGRSDAGPTRQ
jgi:ribose transport system substrate-binding protein